MAYRIGLIEGDGVGPEVVFWGRQVLEKIAGKHGLELEFVPAPVGGVPYLECGEVLPRASLVALDHCHAILKGPLGRPDIEPGIVGRGALLALRRHFMQYINLRPMRLFRGMEDASPLRSDLLRRGVDFVIVRENTEGLYGQMGGADDHTATDISLYTERGVRRILEFAFQLADSRRRNLVSVDKANVLSTSLFWRRKFEAMAGNHPTIRCSSQLADTFCMMLLQDPSPRRWDVVVTDNAFGDIITSEAASIIGSLGMSPSANLNPGGVSTYEPLHGPMTELACQAKANPLASILSTAMLLHYSLEREDLAQKVERAVQRALDEGLRTADVAAGEPACTTEEMGAAVVRQIEKL